MRDDARSCSLLDFIWVMLWGSASAANVISGLVVGFAIVLAVPA